MRYRKKINDHNFVAWLKIIKGIEYQASLKGILVNISPSDYYIFQREYENTHKSLLQEIRALVKKLKQQQSPK
jgi:hypothetical protein